MISSKALLDGEPELQSAARVEPTRPVGHDALDRLVGLVSDETDDLIAGDSRNASSCSPTVTETPGIVRQRREPSASPGNHGCVEQKADRRAW